jgi:ribosomal protein S18 acetylase RimI-like enzyme
MMAQDSPFRSVDLQVEDQPLPTDVAILNDRLYRHNAAITGCDDGRSLTMFVRDEGREIVAGLHGWTWGQIGFVQTLWVREDLRGQGLGARLLATAEVEAACRGCCEMHLDTHSYQAPGFYRRRGYEVLGELPGWPGQTTRIFLRKILRFPSPAAEPDKESHR